MSHTENVPEYDSENQTCSRGTPPSIQETKDDIIEGECAMFEK